ncbi:MAG: hypothetical protein QCI00_06230 [Candidatus Thermoplasmatota archaeon]|nr:hypothetical protein [Candidatus Thermoplasmatota archaeon]
MNNWKFFAGMLLFGSLWGFSEVIIGPAFSEAGLPSGMIMTGFFSLPLMLLSRLLYPKYGMQAGIGAVAGSLRIINPFVGCHLCSAFAIMAQGVLFELIFYSVSTFDFNKLDTWTNKIGLGIFSGYAIYVGSYIVTQILTPLTTGHFYVSNLIFMMPQYLARGLPVAFIGAITVPVTLSMKNVKLPLTDAWYYPTTMGLTACCWMIVIANYMIVTI